VSELAGNNINKLSRSGCVRLTSYVFVKEKVDENTPFFRQDAVLGIFYFMVFCVH
jgi:hypothetical protein